VRGWGIGGGWRVGGREGARDEGGREGGMLSGRWYGQTAVIKIILLRVCGLAAYQWGCGAMINTFLMEVVILQNLVLFAKFSMISPPFHIQRLD